MKISFKRIFEKKKKKKLTNKANFDLDLLLLLASKN